MNRLRLEKTCGACPEQYDVFNKNDIKIAYYRLRHGRFTVEVPDCGGRHIYEAYPKGDGCFTEGERSWYLGEAGKAVIDYYQDII